MLTACVIAKSKSNIIEYPFGYVDPLSDTTNFYMPLYMSSGLYLRKIKYIMPMLHTYMEEESDIRFNLDSKEFYWIRTLLYNKNSDEFKN